MNNFAVTVSENEIDVAAVHRSLAAASHHVGAVVMFTGQVRDTPLEIEAHAPMARRAIAALWEAAQQRWPLIAGIAHHRHGRLQVGETIVVVGTASAERRAAFEAAEYLMDQLKTGAPFWKKEAGRWVSVRAKDLAAARRWERG